jgi:acyl-ACP thioesterase
MFEKIFGVPYYGLDQNGRLKPEILPEFFQETAASHASSVGIGVEDLLERGMTWVLRRYRINIRDCPNGHCPNGREITVKTWFEPQRNLMSVRAFEAFSPDGVSIADAWSAWIVLDLKKTRPVRLDRALPQAYFAATDPTGEPIDDKLPETDGNCDYETIFDVRRRELDLNGHANHTAYLDWALESVPDEAVAGYFPARFDAEYIASAMRERVIVRAKKTGTSPLRFAHSIIAAKTNRESARVETEWRR